MAVPIEVSELIKNSGNNFHAKVARWLSDNGWHVVVSPYYMDQTQNKAREIDLIAEKLWPVINDFNQKTGNIAVRLYVECKFVPSYSAFWFADKNMKSALELVCSNGHYKENNTYTQKHHYLAHSATVAKLFATSTSKTNENEPFYKALNQALNAMVSMRGQPVSTPTSNNNQRPPSLIIEFPIVVCSSFKQIYSADFYAESEPKPITDNFQLEVNYAYIDKHSKQKDDYFLLDFVEFDQLESFAKAIDEDAKVAAFFAGGALPS